MRKLIVTKSTYKTSELDGIDIQENAEFFFKRDVHVEVCEYIQFMLPIYQDVFYRRLEELHIPRRRIIYPTKWSLKAQLRK